MKKVTNIFKWVLLVILTVFVLWTVIHQILLRTDAGKLKQRGEYVIVNEKNINIYKTGEGDKTIALGSLALCR